MAETRTSIRANLDVIALTAVIGLAISFGLALTVALYRNSLLHHADWVATKPTLSHRVMGARAFVSDHQALAKNRLNLGAYFGFQEVLYRQPVEVSTLEFRFRLADDAYLHLRYDLKSDGFSGIRFSNRPGFPSERYEASAGGDFTARQNLQMTSVQPNTWHRVVLEFDEHHVNVTLDGTSAGTFSRLPGPQRIGFRGGRRDAWIDDVILTETNGQVHEEHFANISHQRRNTIVVFSALAVLVAIGWAALVNLTTISLRNAALATALGGLVTASTLLGAYVLRYMTGANYDTPSSADLATQAAWVAGERKKIVDALLAEHTLAIPDDTVRVLALGSSQTWGAGAQSDDDTWVRRLEALLNAERGDTRVECVNAGVSSFKAAQVLDLVRTDLADIAATIAIVDLSNNDDDVGHFERDLDQLVAELRSRNILTVLIMEPNSPERHPADGDDRRLLAKHAVVRKIAERRAAPVIDMHAYLAEREESGFLWWDIVHLTSFGQRIFAEKLAAELRPLLAPRTGALERRAAGDR